MERSEDLARWDGNCGELADAVLNSRGEGHILFVKAVNPSIDVEAQTDFGLKSWMYHMVYMDTDYIVHDAWVHEPLRLGVYLRTVFPDQAIEVSVDGKIEAVIRRCAGLRHARKKRRRQDEKRNRNRRGRRQIRFDG